MSALETEFFNLLESSESRWTALFIEGRTWFNVDVQRIARQVEIDREKANGARFATFRSSNSDENNVSGTVTEVEPEDHEETWRLWATPERRRAKFYVGAKPVDVVIEGSTFWSNGLGRSITNGGKVNHSHGQGDGRYLIQTAEYARVFRVEEVSEGLRLGRDTIEARVTVVDNDDHHRVPVLHGLTLGDADVLELSIDRERGVVLSASSRFQGVVYRVVEITQVVFDPIFDREDFKIEPEFGAEWLFTS